ncbi:hypothetical protein [Aequorivita sp. CIP111184]|uniref:hypothetical protein n=1 Tax=Aequorivita sp. CIP111184 TaxID=2211356 RepID=UPI000DBBCACB|nr:hypothetical protein [Aequorivita sp. CIP111184]SRX56224.1 hypothetical protein AEQU1_03254 [Aequorivita sp. CIP111184]
MKKIILILTLAMSQFIYSQIPYTHIATSNGSAERVANFRVTDVTNDFLEITNSTQYDNSFIPSIWAHQQSDNRYSLRVFASTTSSNDNGSLPLMVFRSEIRNNINLSAPSSNSVFPWGPTSSNVSTRPLFSWENGDTQLMRLIANGNLGIGTINPSAKLHVDGTVRFEGLTNTTTDPYVLTSDSNGNIKRQLISTIGGGTTNNCSSLNFLTKNGSTGLECSSVFDNGNVGIGLSNPQEALHINGNIRGNQTGGALRVQTSNGYVDIGPKSSQNSGFDTDRSAFRFNKQIEIYGGTLTSSASFVPTDMDLKLQTNGVTRIFADSNNGFIGIGLNNPQEVLHINGNIRGNQTSGALRINTTAGYIDIGPKNSQNSGFDTDRSAFRFNKKIEINGGILTSSNSIVPADKDLKLQTNGVTRIFVDDSNGYVGVNTLTPSANLHSKGSARFEDLPSDKTNFTLGIDNDGYVYKKRDGSSALKEEIENLSSVVQKQQEQINKLQDILNGILKNNEKEKYLYSKIVSINPNPTMNDVNVILNIDAMAQDVKLLLNSISGITLSNINIQERNRGVKKIIERKNYSSGTYILALVVNGKVVDSKQIIFK